MTAATAHPYPFQRAMPVLEIDDMGRSLTFYKDKLGFDATTWGEPPAFAIVQRGMVSLALAVVTPGTAKVSRKSWAAYIYVRDADAVHAELAARGVRLPDPPTTKPYNCRDFVVDDPDGHMLSIGHVLSPDALGPGLSNHIGRDRASTADKAESAAGATAAPITANATTAPRKASLADKSDATHTGPWSGGCQCGAVRFHVNAIGRASLCHCRMCQKAFGSVGGLLVTAKDMTWTRGAPAHFQSSNKVQRGFCSACGTPLTFEYDGKVDVAIATFDRAGELPPAVQMARGERLPYTDTLAAIPVRHDEAQWRSNWVGGIVSYQHPDHDTEAWEPKP